MYVSAQHCADPENGCVMPTLSADVRTIRRYKCATYGRQMRELVGKIARALGGKAGRNAAPSAWTIVRSAQFQ